MHVTRLLITLLSFASCHFALPAQTGEGTPKLRVVAYNVACGQWATPERIAKELKDLKPDIVLLSEVPKVNRGKKVKDWSRRLADALDLDHVEWEPSHPRITRLLNGRTSMVITAGSSSPF